MSWATILDTDTKAYKNVGLSDIVVSDMDVNIADLVESKKFLLFGGKGGVGKTTMAAATAVWLADRGHETLVVATDPTVSLSVVFRQKIDEVEETKIDGIPRLHGLNIDPKKAPGVFQKRLQGLTSGFGAMNGGEMSSTPCIEEMAAFDQFVGYLQGGRYDRVVFDTAPTGHTLRELSMPFDWSKFIAETIQNRGELSAALGWSGDEATLEQLKVEKERYDGAIRGLSDPALSAFNLVLLPERLPVEETARAIHDLAAFGIEIPALIVNEVIPSDAVQANPFLARRRALQDTYLGEISSRFDGRIIRQVPLLESEVSGIDSLREIADCLYGGVA